MLSLEIAEELAPFEKASVYEVAVQRYPELLLSTRCGRGIPSAVIRSIPQAV